MSRFLRDRRRLLVLDNCEHVIEGCAELATAFLDACPQVQLLATSREILGGPGEFVVPVEPLAAEDAANWPSSVPRAAGPTSLRPKWTTTTAPGLA